MHLYAALRHSDNYVILLSRSLCRGATGNKLQFIADLYLRKDGTMGFFYKQ